jgi:hypothetical protein
MPRKRTPKYMLHRPTGQARVRIDGHDSYLGPHGSRESRDRYDELVSEWLASNDDRTRFALTIDELSLLFLEHAKTYYPAVCHNILEFSARVLAT